MSEANPIINQPAKPLETYTFTKEDIEKLALEITKNVRASLVGGKVPAEQLPSYVDDVVEGYYYDSKFYEDAEHEDEITPEKSKIYIDLSTNTCYRWSGTLYVLVGSATSDVVAYEGTVSIADTNLQLQDWSLHRAIKENTILWLVFAATIKNTDTSGSHSISYSDTLLEVTLPSDISSKIYRADGTTCNNSYTSNYSICGSDLQFDGASTGCMIASKEPNKIIVYLLASQTWNANYSKTVNFRFPIFLDIGTVQQ